MALLCRHVDGTLTTPRLFQTSFAHPRRTTAPSTPPAASPTISFLFVAHEFYYEDVDHEQDCWGFKCPPTDPDEYGEPFKSRVMRYTDGTITLAEGYDWARRAATNQGYIFKRRGDDGAVLEPTPHDTASVFTCGPPLPVIVAGCDASAEPTFRSSDIPAGLDRRRRTWSLLHFWHASAPDGVSRVVTRYGDFGRMLTPESIRPFAAGGSGNGSGRGDPSWLGTLVPWFFQHPGASASSNIGHDGVAAEMHPSRGLGGMLPIVIGLMALAGCGRRTNGGDLVTPVFVPRDGRRGLWHDHRWRGDGLRGYLRHHTNTPRGYLVQTFYDDIDNGQWSTEELLAHLQWHSIVVEE